MKFGRNLPRNQVPEWASHYINYKGLKKLIKATVQAVRAGEAADTAGECELSTPKMLLTIPENSSTPLIEISKI